MNATIRPATVDDAAEVARIYNHYVLNTVVTFETEAVSPGVMAQRISANVPLPWLIAEQSGRLLGYAYASKWRERPAYRFAVESTIYLQAAETGKGIGWQLYTELIESIKTLSLHTVIAGIALPNASSIRLHERLGFKSVGCLEEAGYKQERWVDVGYWQLLL